MSKITRFEDLSCWDSARDLIKEVYFVTNQEEFGEDHELKKHIRNASLSILNNIVEAFAITDKKESVRLLDLAQSSSAEVRSLIYIAEDLNYLDTIKANYLRDHSMACQKMIIALIDHFKNQQQ